MWSFFVCLAVFLRIGALSEVDNNEKSLLHLSKTSFSCLNRAPGYYADVETGCSTYHVCDGNSHFTYVCPPRTLFQQRSRICDHSYLVRCDDSPNFFDEIYPEDEHEILLRLVESEEQTQTETIDEFTTLPVEFLTTTTTTPLPNPIDAQINTQHQKPNFDIEYPKLQEINHSKNSHTSQNKTLTFVIKDFRSLFYIPEVDNNKITAQAEREFALPIDRKNVIKFKNGKKARHAFSACPGYCDPKFFLPGTCHPCIMIK